MARLRIDPSVSRVWIAARSSVHPIDVETDGLDGWFEVADGDPSPALVAGRLAVDVSSLTSGNPLVDRETRRRLDVRRHPEIIGELTGTRPDTGGALRAEGRVTVRGVSREVSGTLTVTDTDDGVAVEGEQTFDVRTWGLRPPRLLALRVEPEVRVRIRLVGRPAE